MNDSPRIVFMGTPEFAVESLRKLVENGYNVVGRAARLRLYRRDNAVPRPARPDA